MNRRDFVTRVPFVFGLAAGLCELSACGSVSPTGPTPVPGNVNPSGLPTRSYNPNLGGEVYRTFVVEKDGPLNIAMETAGIIPGSTDLISSRDTKTGIAFRGNLIYYILPRGGTLFQPENGFDFIINGREIYDPFNSEALSFNFYQLPVYAGNEVSITLPPKWNGVSD